MDTKTYGALIVCVLIWGTNWPLVKIALADCPPYTFLAFRTFGAAVALGVAIKLSSDKRLLPALNERRDLALVGLFTIFGALTCSTVGLALTQVGRAMLLMYTMQLWAVPLGIWLLGERITRLKILGSTIGFAGVMLFFNPYAMNWHNNNAVIGSIVLLCSAISWALGACLYRKRTWTSGSLQQLLWQLIVCIPPTLIFASIDIKQFHSTSTVWWVLSYNWIAATVLAYWAWNKALSRVSATIAGQFLMFAPLLGFIWSIYLFDEHWSTSAYWAAILIVAGVVLALSDAHRNPSLLEKKI